jgi:hypothetical protein
MSVSFDADEAGEGVASVIVTDPEEAGETGAVEVPGDWAREAGLFCATAAWNSKTAGMIENLNRIGL